ncbi:hypothetical protein D3C73_519090 [compost metagenome]
MSGQLVRPLVQGFIRELLLAAPYCRAVRMQEGLLLQILMKQPLLIKFPMGIVIGAKYTVSLVFGDDVEFPHGPSWLL